MAFDGADIGAAFYRAFGGDDGDGAFGRSAHRRLRTRHNHAHDRHRREHFLQGRQRNGGRGVARHHQHLHLALHQRPGGLHRIACDGVAALGAIGQARGVAQIDELFMGQARHQRAHHREATDAGIENADGGVTHPGGFTK